MSMGINSSYNNSQINYAEQMKEKNISQRAEESKETNEVKAENVSNKIFEPQDEYISGEKSGAKPTGLYRLGHDENGNRKIIFDDPNKPVAAEENEQKKLQNNSMDEDNDQQQISAQNPEKPVEKCTTDTSRVDSEIKRLKETKQRLEQQIQSASGDEKKISELKEKLAQVENELKQKDNDTYRRQNAAVSQ